MARLRAAAAAAAVGALVVLALVGTRHAADRQTALVQPSAAVKHQVPDIVGCLAAAPPESI